MKMLDAISIGEPLVGIYGSTGRNLAAETDYRRVLGGDTSNFALALAKLGHKTGYVTRLGADPFGQAYQTLWRASGLDTSQIRTDPLHPTGLYLTAGSDQSHDFIYYRQNSAASYLRSQDIDEGYIRQARVLHISGISQAISTSCQVAVAKGMACAKEHGLKISYDVNYRPALWPATRAQTVALETIKEYATIVCLTQEEAGLLGYEQGYEQAAADFIDWGVSLVAIKLGGKGCHLFDHEHSVSVPAYPVKVIDTVGAGDAFAAAIVSGCLENRTLEELAVFANLVAALTCRGEGPVKTQPQREEVEALLTKMGRLESSSNT